MTIQSLTNTATRFRILFIGYALLFAFAMHGVTLAVQGRMSKPELASTLVQSYIDGTLVSAQNRPVWAIFGGKRYGIPSPQILWGNGYNFEDVKMLSDAAVNSIPDSGVVIGIDPRYFNPLPMTGNGSNNIEGGTMKTRFTLSRSGQLNATTNTWTKVVFKGFTGGVRIVICNNDETNCWMSQLLSFGVDGTCCGKSNREDFWKETVPRDVAQVATKYRIIQEHAPKITFKGAIDQLGKLRRENNEVFKSIVQGMVKAKSGQ